MTSPYGKDLHHSENATYGDFAFTTQEAGSYLACFSLENNQGTGDVSLHLDWKIGIAAKDWDEVAKKEKIEVNMSMIPITYSYACEYHVELLSSVSQGMTFTQSPIKE